MKIVFTLEIRVLPLDSSKSNQGSLVVDILFRYNGKNYAKQTFENMTSSFGEALDV